MTSRTILFYLILLLATAPLVSSCVRSTQKPDSPQLGSTSITNFPAETWMQYETQEEAGWSSEKMKRVFCTAEQNGPYRSAMRQQYFPIDHRYLI